MDKDINDRNYENYVDIGGKPVRRVTTVDSSGNLINPATSDNQTNGTQKTQIVDSSNVNIPIATEPTLGDVVHALQKIARLLEPSNTRDTSNRQLIYVQGIEGSSLGSAVTTGFCDDIQSSNIYQASGGTRYFQGVYLPVDQRRFLRDQMKNTFANKIRSHLVIT